VSPQWDNPPEERTLTRHFVPTSPAGGRGDQPRRAIERTNHHRIQATFIPHLRNSILAKPNGAGVNGPGGARVINATTPSATITANSGIASRLHSELAGGCVGLGGGVGAAAAGDGGAIWSC
jgi:hypothetical protein